MKNNPPPQKTKSESSGLNTRHPVLACIRLGLVILMMPVALQATTPASTAAVETAVKARLIETYGKLPLSFEANQGQTGEQVKFLSRGHGYTVFLTPTEAVLSLHKPEATHQSNPLSPLRERAEERGKGSDSTNTASTALRMQFIGANPKPHVSGVEALPGKVNYFRGNKPNQWRTKIPTYAKVKYENVWPGIDLVYYGNQRQLEHDFIIAPGADPKTIRLAFSGTNKLAIDPRGDLLAQVAGGEVRLHKPVVFQDFDGKRREIDGRYVLHHEKGQGHARVGFQVASYDRDRPLVIDPVLAYSTFLGGTDFDFATSIAADGAGNVYVAGNTDSNDFPVTPGAFDTSLAGGTPKDDVFVTKFDASGSTLIYSTYLGGGADDTGLGLAIDSAGNAYVTGGTYSSDFPSTPGAFDTTKEDGTSVSDAFVTKLNQSGSALVYSTYLGGSGFEFGYSIAVDSGDNAYVTGSTTLGTTTTPFPTTAGAYDTTYNSTTPAGDAFVTKFNATGTALVYSTFLGGKFGDSGLGITLDGAGNAYVTGATGSDNFPTTSGAFDGTYNGHNSDAFVAKLNASGSALLYSTYLGGAAPDEGTSIVVDGSGNAYVAGWTSSTNFPITPGAFDPNNTGVNPTDGFITKLDAAGAVLLYSTFLGGTSAECGGGIFNATGCHIAIDSLGNAYVTGPTQSSDFPTSAGALDTTHNGNADVFLTQFNASGTGLLYSTFLGSTSSDISTGIALDTLGNVYLAGSTQQAFSPPFFPATPGAYDTSFSGSWDAFVAKVSNTAPPPGVDLSVTKSDAPDPVSVGNDLVYTITVKNAGPLTATGVTLTDTLPTSVSFVSASSGCTRVGTTVTCSLGTLPKDASASILLTVRPTVSGAVGNRVTVNATQPDPNAANNASTTATTVQSASTARADVAVTMSGPSAASLGQKLNYTLTVRNNGPAAATGVMLKDTLPAGLVLLESLRCAASGNAVSCALGQLNSGASTTVTISVNVDNPPGAQVSNTATVRSNLTDPVAANNTRTVLTTVNKSGIYLRVTPTGAGYGQVASDPAGIDCSNLPGALRDCVQNYATGANTVVTLFATPQPGFKFDRWERDGIFCGEDTSPVCVLKMTASRSVTANFVVPDSAIDTTPVKALLLLHGMNSNPLTWNDFVQTAFGNICPEIRQGLIIDPESTTKVLCYRLRFGLYDAISGRKGLGGITAADTISFSGDFSNFDQLGLEVRAAARAILNRHPNAGIVLLGHSRGGLAARAFLQKTSPPERKKVVGLVTTGTPHRGSPLGRIYLYLRNHRRLDAPADWRVVDFLRGSTNCSNVLRFKNPSPLDVRRPTIDDVSSDSAWVRSINQNIDLLPRDIKYGQLHYPLVRLGVLTEIPFQYSVFDRPGLNDDCVQFTTTAEQTIVGPGHTADDYPGDGIVSESSQTYFNIPGFPAPLANQFSHSGRSFTVHTNETKQEADINFILTYMMGTWWTTR